MAGRCNLKLVWAPRRGPALDANTSLISWSQHLDQRRRRREGGGGGIRRIRRSVRVVEGRFSKGRWANRRKRATSHCPREQPCAKPAIREPPWTRFALVNEIKGKKGFVGSEIPSTVLRFYGSGNSFFFFFSSSNERLLFSMVLDGWTLTIRKGPQVWNFSSDKVEYQWQFREFVEETTDSNYTGDSSRTLDSTIVN